MLVAMSKMDWVFSKTFSMPSLRTVPYDVRWDDGSGGFSVSVHHHEASLLSGKIVRSVAPCGRRLLFVGTYYGTVLVYDKEPGNIRGQFVSTTTPSKLLQAVVRPGNEVNLEDMTVILGSLCVGGTTKNIGELTLEIAEELRTT